MDIKFYIILFAHLIGAGITIAIHIKNGTFEWAAKNGDGIRYADPADIFFEDLFGWELLAIAALFDLIRNCINYLFRTFTKE